MPEPHSCPDRASIGFAQEFGSGTFIGTSVQESLSIRNGGVADLQISDISFSGDSAFSMALEPSVPSTIKGNKNQFVRLTFAPTQARLYTGTLTVTSNAVNVTGGTQTFAVSGCGVPTDGGTSPCYRDGGTAP
ncbi:MAG: hypothetical protein AB1938_18370 [Myxococcota bacterium]